MNEQGYGGGDTALGGGQTRGERYPRDADVAAGQQQNATYGGDQTNLDAGADTSYGVRISQRAGYTAHARTAQLLSVQTEEVGPTM